MEKQRELTIEGIWQSSEELPGRFNLKHNLAYQRDFFKEEAHELLDASMVSLINPMLGETYEAETCKEAFDVIYTAFGILQAMGIPLVMFVEYAQEKLNENDAKTPENGYGPVNGKVKLRKDK